MLYLAIFTIGACVGAWCCRWWDNWLADSGDLRSIERRNRANAAINPRRWE